MGEESSSGSIDVLRDMRKDWDANAVEEKQAFIAEYYALVGTVTDAMDKITEANQIATRIESLNVNNDELGEKVKSIKGALKEMTEQFSEPRIQGLFRNPNLISSVLGNVRGKMGNSYKPVTQPQQLALQNAKTKVGPFVDSVNTFFSNDWAAF